MDNVPSSAILAIVAIVAACILGAFIFTTVQSQKEAGNSAINKVDTMNSTLDESTYTQYDGATVTGSQVLAAIKLLKTNGVAIIVDNGNQSTEYLNTITSDPAGGNENTGTWKTVTKGTIASNADTSGDHGKGFKNATESTPSLTAYSDLIAQAKNKTNANAYITPSANFVGSIVRDSKNGSIIGVVFTIQQ